MTIQPPTFVNTHLALERENFMPRLLQPGLRVVETKPDLATFSRDLAAIGGPWGWARRPKYQDLAARLEGARYFHLVKDGRPIGYALTRPLESLTLAFAGRRVTEIENFGLLPSENGKGYGIGFLHAVMDHLFKDADTVYLSTRSTNHPKVVKFYEEAGMQVIAREILPDDLLPITWPAPIAAPHRALK